MPVGRSLPGLGCSVRSLRISATSPGSLWGWRWLGRTGLDRQPVLVPKAPDFESSLVIVGCHLPKTPRSGYPVTPGRRPQCAALARYSSFSKGVPKVSELMQSVVGSGDRRAVKDAVDGTRIVVRHIDGTVGPFGDIHRPADDVFVDIESGHEGTLGYPAVSTEMQ